MTLKSDDKNFSGRLIPILLTLVAIPVAAAVYQAVAPAVRRAASDFFYPYIKVAKIPVSVLTDKTLLFFTKTELAARVEHLVRINNQLATQAVSAAELMRENDRLRRLAGLKARPHWRYVNAQVLLRDPLRWQEHIVIDRGEKDGIRNGCAVVVADLSSVPVLAGVISSVGKNTSIVNTVYNPLLKLSGKVGNKSVGFINATNRRGTGRLVPVDYLPGNSECQPGEAVVTTGFEHRIPGGIKIGELASVSERRPVVYDGPFRSGFVKVSFDPNSLRFVTIITPEKENMEQE